MPGIAGQRTLLNRPATELCPDAAQARRNSRSACPMSSSRPLPELRRRFRPTRRRARSGPSTISRSTRGDRHRRPRSRASRDICAMARSRSAGRIDPARRALRACRWPREATSRKVDSAAAATAAASARPSALSGAPAASSRTPRVARSSISICARSSSTVKRADDIGLERKLLQNAGAERVDGLHLEAARRVERGREQARARARLAASMSVTPIARMAASSAASSSAIQRRSVSKTRAAMLAAAALVKVMHRIFAGSTPPMPPSSSSRITRCASTWVLPEPALAATNAAAHGSDASACRRGTASGMMRRRGHSSSPSKPPAGDHSLTRARSS